MKLTERKSFRYGSASVGLTVAVVAVVIVFNVIVSAIFSAVGQHFDMTAGNLFELSDTADTLVSERADGTNQVTIYFMATRDELNQTASAANYYSDYSLWGMKYILELADELAKRHDYISVEFLDLNSQSAKIKNIVGNDYYNSHTFGTTSVLIDNYTPERDNYGEIVYNQSTGEPQGYWHNFRLYNRNSFYGFNNSSYVTSFKGEYRFVSAILSITEQITPTAYFITGHGEPVGEYVLGEENEDYGDAANLWNVLRDSGYKIRKIDLQYEDFDHSGNAVAIIYGPTTDYISSENSDTDGEIGKLKAFLETSGNSLMVFLSADAQKRLQTPSLERFLEEVGGIDYLDAKLKDDGTAGITTDGYSLVGTPAFGGSDLLSQRMNVIEDGEKVIFRNVRPIRVTDASKATALFTVPASSFADTDTAEAVETSDALLTFSSVSQGSYVLATGTTLLPSSSYTERAEYANREVLMAALGIMSGDSTAYAIDDKVIPNEGLNLTTSQATVWTVILSLGLPTVIAVIGLVVNIRRRYS